MLQELLLDVEKVKFGKMKNSLRKIIKEEVSKITIDNQPIDRKYGYKLVGRHIVDKMTNNGYKPYYVEGTKINEIPTKNGEDLTNKWGYIYFFNEKEYDILSRLSENITKMTIELEKSKNLYNQYLLSFIETSGKI